MKKLLAFILCLTMAMGTVAFAEEVTGTELNKDVLEGSTNVSLTIDPDANSFVVVIPASVTIDPETKYGYFDVVLKAGWKLVSSNSLKVKIKGFANTPTSNNFQLKNAEGTTANYSLGYSGYSTAISDSNDYTYFSVSSYSSTSLITVSKSTSTSADKAASLKLYVPTLPTEPGEYTDTITFAITLE